MIIDASALAAIVFGEPGWEALREALASSPKSLPVTAMIELHLATAKRSARDAQVAEALLASLLAEGLQIDALEGRHATAVRVARDKYGKGNGRGGKLNFGDLMVYAVAKERNEPLLCTGRDFATTDLKIHPASRLDQ